MSSDPAARLRQHSLRVTPQRRAILAAFTGSPEEHLSAEEVHARAVAKVPELGRGTVYATLAELTELGLLAAIGNPEPIRYETNVEPHEHFRCQLCLRTYDIELAAPSTTSLTRRGFTVERLYVTAEGTCANCRDYERGVKDGANALTGSAQVSSEALGTLACAPYESRLGTMQIAASKDGIVRMSFEEHADFKPFAARGRSRHGSHQARRHIAAAIQALQSYLEGDHRQADDTLDADAIALPSPEALRATRRIEYGRSRSYERLGVPIAPYECGYAVGANPMPILFPCHRVTRGSQYLSHYVGGHERHELLLAFERAATTGAS